MNILVLGASGYIGSHIKKMLEKKYKNVYGTYRRVVEEIEKEDAMYPFRLEDEGALEYILEQTQPDKIISCLRGDFDLQFKAHKRIADYLSHKEEGQLIYLSTANVFDGALEAAHYESDSPNAKSEYGKFKIRCEEMLLRELNKRCIIIRVPQVWGTYCPRIVALKKAIVAKESIPTVKNRYVNVTTDTQVCQWISYIIEQDLTGIFHIGTSDVVDYFAFQQELIKALSLEEPMYEVEYSETKSYQAVLPGRREIPDRMKQSVQDIINQIALK